MTSDNFNIKKLLNSSKTIFTNKGGIIDKGAIYITIILTILIFGSFIFTGGVLPAKLPNPSTELVRIITKPVEPSRASLQLQTFQGEPLTPVPTTTPLPTSSPFDPQLVDCGSGTVIKGSSEPQIIWAFVHNSSPASGNQNAFKVFYRGSAAMLLGRGNVSPMTNHPSDHIENPLLGDTSYKDIDKFPISPAIYITDITQNPSDISGDAQAGGEPSFPNYIYGTWKAEGNPDPTPSNGITIGAGGDDQPPANGPGGSHGYQFSSEVIWKTSSLNTISQHTYRVQIALHKGDNPDKIGVVCYNIKIP